VCKVDLRWAEHRPPGQHRRTGYITVAEFVRKEISLNRRSVEISPFVRDKLQLTVPYLSLYLDLSC
jgi:hypothetical protein